MATNRPSKAAANPLESDAPALTKAQQQAAVALPIVDPEPFLGMAQPGMTPNIDGTPTGVPNKRVKILRTERSASAGGAHYSLSTGDIMDLPLPVADGLIAQRLAEEI